jgi:hypothetical protein
MEKFLDKKVLLLCIYSNVEPGNWKIWWGVGLNEGIYKEK